jgi:hypothetical protein
MLAAACFSSAQATPDLTTYIAINEPSTARTMESTGASLTDSASGPRNNVYAYTSYGSINVSGQGSAPASPENPGVRRIDAGEFHQRVATQQSAGGAGPHHFPPHWADHRGVPLFPNGATECRSGGANGNHAIVFTFSSDIVSGSAAVTNGTGTIAGSPVIAGNAITINLTGVADVQRLAITLSDVTDTNAQVLPDTAITAGFLLGDTVGNDIVNSTDIAQSKSQSGAALTASNFRADINASGVVNASDIGQVKVSAGHLLP